MAAKKAAKATTKARATIAKKRAPKAPKAAANGAATGLRKPVEGNVFTERLPIAADVSEQAAAGAELAKLVDELEALKIERRDVMAKLKERFASVHERMNELAGIYKGQKLADVQCRERLYVEQNLVEVVRLDTGEIVRSRTATIQDRQLDLEKATREKFAPDAPLKSPDEVGAKVANGQLASDIPEDELLPDEPEDDFLVEDPDDADAMSETP